MKDREKWRERVRDIRACGVARHDDDDDADTGCNLEDLRRAMVDRDGLRERERERESSESLL